MDSIKDKTDLEEWMKSVTLQLKTLQLTLDRIRHEHLIVCPNTLLDVVDIANMMKMSPKTVYKWVYQEKIKSSNRRTKNVLFQGFDKSERVDEIVCFLCS